jgi:HK97 family phage major capsid protein
MTRDMQATVFPSGGAFVPTQLVVPVIEILRNRMILDTVGKRTMAGLQGNIVIPRQEAAATAYAVSEIGALTDTAQILGQIALSPRRVGATQTYSKQFVMQSSPDAEAFMRDDLFKVIALAWDRLGINGQGAASEPLGILNTPGIASIVFGATPTYIKIVAMETAIRAANVTDELAYLSTPTVKGALKTVAEALTGATTIGGSQNALWKGKGPDGEMNGYPAHDTNQIPGNQVLLGAFSQLIHAIWGGLDVVVDVFTKAKQGETVLTINTYGDFALRHPQAFCASADAGNQ